MRDQEMLWDRFPPPPFITTPVAPGIVKGRFDRVWWPLKKLNYDNCSMIFGNDVYTLGNILQWKGQQMRADNENAVLISERIAEHATLWQHNQLRDKIMEFKDAFPVDVKGIDDPDTDTEVKLPSYQWLQWMIYMVLRDAALLVKIKVDCETVLDIWLAHLEDKNSLFISSVLSRMWYLSRVMVEELNTRLYPFLFKLTTIIQPVHESHPWPQDSWKVPNPKDSFMDWLRETFDDLSFQPANMDPKLTSLIKKDNAWILLVLENGDDIPTSSQTQNNTAGNTEVHDSKFAEELVQAKRHVEHEGGEDEGAQMASTKIKIKTEPDEHDGSSSESAPDHDEEDSSSNDSDAGVTTIPRSVKVKSELSKESEGSADEGPPPAKKASVNTQASEAVQCNHKQEERMQSFLYGELMGVNSVPAFQRYWELFFAGMHPHTEAGRKEVLHRINECRFPPRRKFFTPPYKQMWLAVQRDVTSLGQVVWAYDSDSTPSVDRLSFEDFVSRFNLLRKNLEDQIEQLAKWKAEQVGRKQEKWRRKKQTKAAKKAAAAARSAKCESSEGESE